jgi:hypothetical protein
MSLNAIITNALADAASQMTTQVLHLAISRLATKYGFDFAEAIQFINLEPARPEVLKKSDLPWCGVVDAACCGALSFRGGIYSQCHKAPVTDGLCGACYKQKQETGSLKNGDVAERMASSPFEFRGGKVARFSKLMMKNGWTQELVERSAAEYGLTIPPENFVETKPKRGRKVTRPVMATPEPPAITTTETVVPPVEVAADESTQEVPAPTSINGFTIYPTDADSDEELEAEPIVTAAPVAPAAKAPKKKREPKPEGEKKKREPKPEGEKKKKEKKSQKNDSDSESSGSEESAPVTALTIEAPVAAAEAESPESPEAEPDSPPYSPEAPVEAPAAAPAETPAAAQVEAAAAPEKAEGEKKKKVDYSNITAVDAATLKPMALRTACAQHGIDIGSKSADTLRTELIHKLA